MRRSVLLWTVLLAAFIRSAVAQNASTESIRIELAHARELSASLASKVDPIISEIWNRFDSKAAMDLVTFMSSYWRLAGNAGYDASIDRVRSALLQSGFADGKDDSRPSLWVEEGRGQGRGWDHTVGTLSIVRDGQPDEIALSKDKERLALCINSFSTPLGGIVAPIIDAGPGDQPSDYMGKDVKGAVVLGDADTNRLWRAATDRGAIGIISTSLAAYVNPQAPGATPNPRNQWDILQWSSIPYDETRKGFGFKATPKAAATLRRALASGSVRVRVQVVSAFSNAPERTLIAEIPGSRLPNQRVIIAAHVQEPGANDNASGVATLQEMARALAQAIATGKIPRPERTITMLWLNEISGSRQWLQKHADEKSGLRYMFSMDMTGEDISKTGGSFLVERWPDPGAVWDRVFDPHTEWGKSDVKAESLKGDLINDFHLAICERVATRSKWTVRSNPYEGGSDHTVFGSAGIPSLLNWHFTDRYYHTNMDTADKTSPAEMRNVGTAVIASAWLLASTDQKSAMDVAELVAKAGKTRIAIEEREKAEPVAVEAWKKWYREAVLSASRLVTEAVTQSFTQALTRLASSL